ncbi:DNA repair exonuclease [Cognatishimia sp. F0-27]|uniref:metallophosphoesterase family protein n=1 Tax=Cognatishimia sp. F0-27 TaxID=2816855 RepID=UPI001D0C86B6|nr:DNA repair exonuclease [Cognatishimia sp. F0-27]MCC1492618.1 DNA repair exonuclease [Cognatishimia sp. F0-27]
MKFLHVADLHLDSPLKTQAARDSVMGESLRAASRQVLSRLVDAAIAEGVDAVLFAGDTFDSDVADVASRAALATELARLARAGIPAVLIQGNHDALLDLDRYGPVSEALTVLTPDAPTVQVGDASIHGMGFTAPHMAESLLPRYPAPEPGRWNIGMMHTSLDGAVGHDPYAPCALSDLLGHGYDYWALGHIHKRAVHEGEGALVVMPGIPQGRSIRETEGGSATLMEIDLHGVRQREVPLELLRFTRVVVDFSGVGDQAGRDARLRAALEAVATRSVMIAVRLDAVGSPAELGDPRMLEAQAREAAGALAGVFVNRLKLRPATHAPDSDMAEDLVTLMRADAATAGFRDEVLAQLKDLRAALPQELRDVLAEDRLDALIEAGVETMALRLGAGRADQ